MKVDQVRRVAVVGAGMMGHGIAQEFACAGYTVHLHDLSEKILQQAVRKMQDNLQMLVDAGCVTSGQAEHALTNVHTSTVLQDVVADVDVVIEAVFEDLALKQQVFQELDKLCPQRTILASTTSAVLPSKLASVTQRPDKVVVTHFDNPPYLLPLVEVVRNEKTSDETVIFICNLLRSAGKAPVIVQKEVPGFIENRLLAALFREAMSIVAKGIASPQDVDTVIKTGFGRRSPVAGIFESYEIAGWDLVFPGVSRLLPEIDSSLEFPPGLREKVERGELGVKTGKGFYEWTPESAEALRQRILQALVQMARWS
ncbi:MAG: 3-hydroxyacyl-CoA dehydrogenase family protein [Anaerolineae bacterium]